MRPGRQGGGSGADPSISESTVTSRLLEDPTVGPPSASTEAWAVDLLRATTPYEVPAGRKQRVRLLLSHDPRSPVPLWLRPAIVGALLIGCGAASAALGPFRGWPARTYHRIVGKTDRAAAEGPARASRPAVPRRAERAIPAVSEPSPASPEIAVVVPEPPREPTVSTQKRRPAAAPSDEDTASVMEAMRALRLDNNPLRARALLARYLERHPTGTLADEALAMMIQAAVAHHDPDAPSLAARYLRLHPNGPFRALARDTLGAAVRR